VHVGLVGGGLRAEVGEFQPGRVALDQRAERPQPVRVGRGGLGQLRIVFALRMVDEQILPDVQAAWKMRLPLSCGCAG